MSRHLCFFEKKNYFFQPESRWSSYKYTYFGYKAVPSRLPLPLFFCFFSPPGAYLSHFRFQAIRECNAYKYLPRNCSLANATGLIGAEPSSPTAETIMFNSDFVEGKKYQISSFFRHAHISAYIVCLWFQFHLVDAAWAAWSSWSECSGETKFRFACFAHIAHLFDNPFEGGAS